MVSVENVLDVIENDEGFIEIIVDRDLDDEIIKNVAAEFNLNVTKIE